MAFVDKDIVITPNKGSSTNDPTIVFSGADSTEGPNNISLKVYPTNSGTLSFEATQGSIFTIENNLLSGSIFRVNDVSGIPSIDVDVSGTIKLGTYGGNVGIGITNPLSKLSVDGGAYINGSVGIGTTLPFTTYSNSLTLKAKNGDLSSLWLWSDRSSPNANHGAIYFYNQQAEQIASIISSGSTSTAAVRFILKGTTESTRILDYGVLIGTASSTGTTSQRLQVSGGAYVSGSTGIGTTNPQYKLHVIGDAYITGEIGIGSSLTLNGGLYPAIDATYDLGSPTYSWKNIYTNDLNLSNEKMDKGNDIDGTKGNWTIQEGEDDLYIINNKNGKKYKFTLEEIL